VNLATGGFRCFACGAKGGDVIAFLRLRYGLDFVSACRQLGAWKVDRRISASALRDLKRHRERQDQCVATIAEKFRELRVFYRDEIYLCEQSQRWTSELLRDPSITPEEVEFCWRTLASILSQLRSAIAAYYLLSFGRVGECLDFVRHPEGRDSAIQAVLDRGTVCDDRGFTMEVDFGLGQTPAADRHGMDLTFP
jgi:hypothetical protein